MTCEARLDPAMARLQRRGRGTYRRLRLQCQLDEAQLEALQEALIAAERLAVEEEGHVLVWAGPPASPPPASAPQGAPPATDPDQAPPVAEGPATAAGPVPPRPDAERRQRTVRFCDLVDSTQRAAPLDPADWRDVVRASQRVGTDVIQRYDGPRAPRLGEGLLVDVGYPHAQEDDAPRAGRTGWGRLAALGDLKTHLPPAQGIQRASRGGRPTGLVVVGEMGGTGRQAPCALGAVPNVCARLEGRAAPPTIAMSAATSRFVPGSCACQA